MWAFITSQLLMPELRGAPVYASTKRAFRSSAIYRQRLAEDARRVESSMADTPPYMAG